MERMQVRADQVREGDEIFDEYGDHVGTVWNPPEVTDTTVYFSVRGRDVRTDEDGDEGWAAEDLEFEPAELIEVGR